MERKIKHTKRRPGLQEKPSVRPRGPGYRHMLPTTPTRAGKGSDADLTDITISEATDGRRRHDRGAFTLGIWHLTQVAKMRFSREAGRKLSQS